jgi:hypothetical protein
MGVNLEILPLNHCVVLFLGALRDELLRTELECYLDTAVDAAFCTRNAG